MSAYGIAHWFNRHLIDTLFSADDLKLTCSNYSVSNLQLNIYNDTQWPTVITLPYAPDVAYQIALSLNNLGADVKLLGKSLPVHITSNKFVICLFNSKTDVYGLSKDMHTLSNNILTLLKEGN